MANIDNPSGFEFYRAEAGHAEFDYGAATSGITIKQGDLLTDDGAGRLRLWTATDSTVVGVSQVPLTSATADDEILYIKAKPGVMFAAQCSGTYAIALRDTTVDVEGTTGIMEVNEDAVANPVFTIRGETGEYNSDAIGAHTRVFGEFGIA